MKKNSMEKAKIEGKHTIGYLNKTGVNYSKYKDLCE